MFELSKQFIFESAHTLQRDIETEREGSRRVHGHSYRAVVTVMGEPDPDTGMLVDLGLLERALTGVRDRLDHHFLNDVPGLGAPTLENLALWIWRALADGQLPLARVGVFRDATGDSCAYTGLSD
jgi:6-pyruvoyltetrahydropterin/6-carboxytetrahydropterin synthase